MRVRAAETYLELLNLTLSSYAHTSITLWSDEVLESKWALGMLEGAHALA